MGNGWRIPTATEWNNVVNAGVWTDWNGPWDSALKMHAAGKIFYSDHSLNERGVRGHYYSSTQSYSKYGWDFYFGYYDCDFQYNSKANGYSVRCIE